MSYSIANAQFSSGWNNPIYKSSNMLVNYYYFKCIIVLAAF